MASEITASFVLKAVKGGITYVNEAKNQSLTLTSAAPSVSRYTLTATTAAQGVALDLGAVAANGVCWLENTDATNYVDVGVRDGGGTFFPLVRLLAGEAWPIRVTPGAAPYAKANSASVVLKQPLIDA
jgi:hypothetical protein